MLAGAAGEETSGKGLRDWTDEEQHRGFGESVFWWCVLSVGKKNRAPSCNTHSLEKRILPHLKLLVTFMCNLQSIKSELEKG